jgi:protein-S-isoprenylcysteine O-methyltransferase Ste14
MKVMQIFMKCFVYLSLLAVLFPKTAHAYLDPGTASMLLQTLAAAAIASAVLWSRIKAKFRSLLSTKKMGNMDTDKQKHEDKP